MFPLANIFYQLPCHAEECPQAEWIIGVGDIQQMMGDSALLQGGGFGSTNVHVAVHLPAVGVDYLATKSPAESNRQAGFAGGGGANYGYEWRCRRVH